MTRDKALAFQNYAYDTEGMHFSVSFVSFTGQYVVTPMKGYDKQVIASVKRNFNEEWKFWNSGPSLKPRQ